MSNSKKTIIQTQGRWESLPEIFGVPRLAEFLAIGSAKAYELVRQEGFPSFMVGKMYRVSKEGLKSWINRQVQKNDMCESQGVKGRVSRHD